MTICPNCYADAEFTHRMAEDEDGKYNVLVCGECFKECFLEDIESATADYAALPMCNHCESRAGFTEAVYEEPATRWAPAWRDTALLCKNCGERNDESEVILQEAA